MLQAALDLVPELPNTLIALDLLPNLVHVELKELLVLLVLFLLLLQERILILKHAVPVGSLGGASPPIGDPNGVHFIVERGHHLHVWRGLNRRRCASVVAADAVVHGRREAHNVNLQFVPGLWLQQVLNILCPANGVLLLKVHQLRGTLHTFLQDAVLLLKVLVRNVHCPGRRVCCPVRFDGDVKSGGLGRALRLHLGLERQPLEAYCVGPARTVSLRPMRHGNHGDGVRDPFQRLQLFLP
mmetsp:Transcript_140457/g.244538  ORF Transcript_140457/g.244538 Transcript_140457/m.244538 type:complete len:241 (-) Transcript_140457:739-1461(-)